MFIEKLKKENKNYEEAIVNLKNLRNERTVCIEEGFEESQHHKSKSPNNLTTSRKSLSKSRQ